MNLPCTEHRSGGASRPIRKALVVAFGSALLSAALVGVCFAAESAPRTSPRAIVTLVSNADSVTPGQTFRIGLRQKLAPHWHSYWKNPGDAGSPPNIAIDLPEGATASGIFWPGPDGIAVGPARSFGYETEIVFPIDVTVPQTATLGETFSVRADADWVVCEKECIPESGSFRLDLPVSQAANSAGDDVARAFAAADARMPVASPWAARLTDEGPALALTVAGEGISAASVESAFFFPADWGVVVFAAAQQLTVEEGRLRLAMEKGLAFDPKARITGLLAVTDSGGRTRWFETAPTIEVSALASSGDGTGPLASGADRPLLQTVLFAFLGGLILNLMPCVFPVLAIKATSLAGLAGGPLREVRLSGLFYTLGVLVAFLALAGILLGLRAVGAAVGWGFQFQSPLFVAALSWLLLAIGLNLSGVYEIGLGATRIGQGFGDTSGHAGSFFTGLLAVVVATPCTAPFMGVAIGTALAASPAICVALFVALGLGLAAPYALLGIFPRLARQLPRPGVWMLRLRQAMAFPMYASAAWLVWVLTRQVGDFGLMIVLTGTLLVGLAAWSFGIAQHETGKAWFSRGLAATAIAGLAALLAQLAEVPGPSAATRTTNAEPFTGARLAALRQEGKPVFVNMTAAWCITCLVNERTTLSTTAVRQAFDAHGVTYLKGDWTNRDPEITAFLRSFDRDGLPFYAFYPAKAPNPIVLPPVLTETMVVNEVQRTSRTDPTR